MEPLALVSHLITTIYRSPCVYIVRTIVQTVALHAIDHYCILYMYFHYRFVHTLCCVFTELYLSVNINEALLINDYSECIYM